MKKFSILILAIILLAALLVGCSTAADEPVTIAPDPTPIATPDPTSTPHEPDPTPDPTPEVTPDPTPEPIVLIPQDPYNGLPVRGVWYDNLYISEYLGLQLEVPGDDWEVNTSRAEEINAHKTGASVEFLKELIGKEIPTEIWDTLSKQNDIDWKLYTDTIVIVYQMVEGTANISISFIQLTSGMTINKYFDEIVKDLKYLYTNQEYVISREDNTTTIGPHEWQLLIIDHQMEEVPWYPDSYIFANIQGDFLRIIEISTWKPDRVTEALSWFSTID